MYLKTVNIIKTHVYRYTYTKVTLLEAIILQSRATDKTKVPVPGMRNLPLSY